MLHVVPKQKCTLALCERYLTTVPFMISLLGASWFYAVFMFGSRVSQVSLRDCLGVFRIKYLFHYFLIHFQNFKVIINSNAVKYNYQDQMRWMTINE